MIYVALPAYNEEDALPPLLDRFVTLREEGQLTEFKVLVVDDGSADSTAEVVSTYHDSHPWIELVAHPQNMGLSQAIQTGFKTALAQANPGDVIITLDADNTQPPETIPAMLQRMEDGADVVIASRFQPGAEVYGVPAMRRFYSRMMSILFQVAFTVPGVRDYSCGFRSYRAEALQLAFDTYGETGFITEEGFACMVEILFQLKHLKTVSFGEVPFVLRYDLKPGETKMNVRRTITDTLRLALRHRINPPQVSR